MFDGKEKQKVEQAEVEQCEMAEWRIEQCEVE